MPSALEFARELIEFDSVSARSNVAVSDHVSDRLRELGFEVERVSFLDPHGVPKSNVIAKRGTGTGGLAFFGHTDVVPADDWKFAEHGPFAPTLAGNRLYGRGSTDMKGPIACFLAAVAEHRSASARAPVYICCTADEEVGMHGVRAVVQRSQLYREMVAGDTRCIVGEPTGLKVIHAHKGGTGVTVTSRGIAAHSSGTKGINANWKMIPFLMEVKQLHAELESDATWQNADFAPPTMSLNITVNDHTQAVNITAPESVCRIYFRAMPDVPVDPVLARLEESTRRHGLEFKIDFRCPPFRVDRESSFVKECLAFASDPQPRTVSYGTDAAWLGELKRCVIFGPGDIAQAHTHDEFILLSDLERGTRTYARMLAEYCG